MPTSLHASVVYIHMYLLSAIMKRAFPTLVVLKIPQMFTWVIFKDIENGRHLPYCIFVVFTILKR